MLRAAKNTMLVVRLFMYVYVDKCTYTGFIGGLLANTIHCLKLHKKNGHGKCVALPQLTTPFPSVA